MSAAATAAGYLYASGRLRGRSAREQDQNNEQQQRPEEKKAAPPRQEVRVAVLPQPEERQQDEERSAGNPALKQPRRTPKIEYRRRRWSAA